MRQEQIVNNAQTLLSAGIDNSQTNIPVSDGSVFPSEGDFRIVIDSELLLVTAISGNTLTAERGVEGSTAASHSSAADVKAVVSEGSFEQRLSDFQGLVHVGTTPPLRLMDGSTVLTASSFTWTNQGTATATDRDDGAIIQEFPLETGNNFRYLYRSAPGSTPYSIIIGLIPAWFHDGTTGTGYPQAGIGIQNSGDSKMVTFNVHRSERNTSPCVQISHRTSPTAFDTSPTGLVHFPFGPIHWLKFTDTGTNHEFYCSPDGSTWVLFHTQSRTVYLSNAGDRVGWGGNAAGWDGTGLSCGDLKAVLRHWSVS